MFFVRPQRQRISLQTQPMTAKQRLFGDAGQAILREAKVGIIGLGGVGMLLAEYLGRLGVGHFVLIEPERVSHHRISLACREPRAGTL